MTTIAEDLSLYTTGLTYQTLPGEVIHEVRRRLIDSLACAMGAYDSAPVQIARRVAQTRLSTPGATLIGTRAQTSPEMAAFVNGLMIRYLDYNDSYISGEFCHPSDNISTALAIGQVVGASGRDVIVAIVLGYEVMCRLCDAAVIRTRGWDHVTYGALTTCLVAAKLLALEPSQICHGLGLAGAANVALRQTRSGQLSMWKGAAFGNAARNGIFAALMAKEGMTGPSPIFEGDRGIWRQVSGPFTLSPLGSATVPFRILASNLKFYPADYHAQSAIDAALAVRNDLEDVSAIERVEIETFSAAIETTAQGEEKWNPQSRETADHSLPYCVAVALLDGEVRSAQFSESRMADPLLRTVLRSINVKENTEFSNGFPEANTNLVRVITKAGAVIERTVRYPRGHVKNPMTDAQIEDKFCGMAEPLLPTSRIRRVLDCIWQLDELDDLDTLLNLLAV